MIRIWATILAAFMLLPVTAMARGSSSTALQETYHIGVIGGDFDNGTSYGKVASDGFILMARNSKMSLEYINYSSDDGALSTGGSWNTSGQGLFLALLGQGNPYMKFKVGSIKQELVETVSGVDTITSDSIKSYGLGFGYKFGSQGIIEIDVTSLDGEATLVTLGLLY